MSLLNRYIARKLACNHIITVVYCEPCNHDEFKGRVIGSTSNEWIIQSDASNFVDWDCESPYTAEEFLSQPCIVLKEPIQLVTLIGDDYGNNLLQATLQQ